MHTAIRLVGVGTTLAAVALGAGTAAAERTSVTDPRNDTEMHRNGPDVVASSLTYGKRIVVKVTYDSAADLAYARNGGTITGANLKFKNGKAYTLQRHAADESWQTPLKNEIIKGGTAKRVQCDGVTSAVSSANRQVTVSAPTSCFKGEGTKLKAQGFSFTVNFDVDETRWSKRVAKG